MTSASEKGLALFEEIYGAQMAQGLAQFLESDGFGVELARWSNDFSFGTIWSSSGLERKLRSCVVLGMMIALRQADEIRHHTKMGLANGLSRKEIEEILYTAVPYCGFPAANVAKASMLSAFKELEGASSSAAG
jgi:alkylhydroperoxidase/carboxymuconolactone decarboxylase family protein YurZ